MGWSLLVSGAQAIGEPMGPAEGSLRVPPGVGDLGWGIQSRVSFRHSGPEVSQAVGVVRGSASKAGVDPIPGG